MTDIALLHVPSAYPGEILGSWLARTADRNGSALWLRFATQFSTRHTRAPSGFVDSRFINSRNVQLQRVVEALGVPFSEALTRMTLFRYWRKFSAPGGTTAVEDVGARAFKGTGTMALCAPKFCPDCLREAVERLGEPYWQCKHQLPNVFGCDVHHVLLRDRCKDCGRIPPSYAYRSMSPLATLCECGAKLCNQRTIFSAPAPYWKLVALSCEALRQPPPREQEAYASSFMQILRAKYGKDSTAAFVEHAHSAMARGNVSALVLDLRPDRRRVTTREICIWLALAGIGLTRGVTMLRHEMRLVAQRSSRLQGNKVSLAEAKCELKRRISAAPDRVAHLAHFGTAYWIVRLRDPSWIDKQFPSTGRRRPIPSIEVDRRNITRILHLDKRNTIYSSSAAGRARLRDQDWYKAALRDTLVPREDERKARVMAARSARLLQAAITLSKYVNVPATFSLLGRMTELSTDQLYEMLERNWELRSFVVDATGLKFTIRKCADAGKN